MEAEKFLEIKRISELARDALEEFANSQSEYRWNAESLQNACASGALLIHQLLVRSKLILESAVLEVYNEDDLWAGCHVWTWADHKHIDITCTQFGGPRIYIGDEPYLSSAEADRLFVSSTGKSDSVVITQHGCTNGTVDEIAGELMNRLWPEDEIIAPAYLHDISENVMYDWFQIQQGCAA